MRRIFVLALCAILFFDFCAEANDSDVIEIREKMFIEQTNDVYINVDEYLGRTIKLEGIFGIIEDDDPICYYVYRFGPGCCGYDANAGFEVTWKNEGQYANEDDWVEATGVLESYEIEGEPLLRLALTSLVVKAERGKERVEQ